MSCFFSTQNAGSSDVYIGNVIFQNNSGVVGGAMHVLNSNVTLNGTNFLGNSAKLHGGALMLVNSNLNIDSCLFFRNNVSTQPADLAGTGGAIYFLGVNDLSISNSEFSQNVGERAGGAIFMDLNSNTAIKTFKGKFSGNYESCVYCNANCSYVIDQYEMRCAAVSIQSNWCSTLQLIVFCTVWCVVSTTMSLCNPMFAFNNEPVYLLSAFTVLSAEHGVSGQPDQRPGQLHLCWHLQ